MTCRLLFPPLRAHIAPRAGKYSKDSLPPGPRGRLFAQLLPGVQPLLDALAAVAAERRKTMSQVCGLLCALGVGLRVAGRQPCMRSRTLLPTLVAHAMLQFPPPPHTQVAINWCMAKGTLPIPGAKDLAQARDNLGALGWRLSAGQVAELDAAAARCTKQALQNIFQTR
jgi:pyridoxine 4-dehydrogenase